MGVNGIPSSIILDADGKVITKDGRQAVSDDPVGEEFPWKPKTLQEVLNGAKIIGQDGQELQGESLFGKVFAFYFSAHWCPPCRDFTPQLAQWVLRISSQRDWRWCSSLLTGTRTSSRTTSRRCHGWLLTSKIARGKRS